MAFSVNTNIASLQAQNYLRTSSEFQSKTINRVTSGLRIVSSGDDAAGLAIANGFRSDEAVLTQGIRNANDGLSTLQTIDGGMNNISQLLDRARTLATQSASGTFTGGATGRGQLNSEFQSVMTEIDRQAQSIGLDTGGEFAKALSVFIGGGRANNGSTTITNGSASVDLSSSTVDTKSLGMKGYTAGYQVAAGVSDSGLYDLGNSSVSSVSAIKAATGQATATFVISGGGFSDANAITVTANLAGVSDSATLVSSINAGITSAAMQGSAAALAFKAANVVASIHTGTDGHQQLLFTSSSSTFAVRATNTSANGFMGNLGTNANGSATNATATPEALAASSTLVAGGSAQYIADYTTGLVKATPENQTLTFTSYDDSGNPFSTQVTLLGASAAGANLTAAEAVAQINTQLQATDVPSLQKIVATTDGVALNQITFSSVGSRFDMSIAINNGVAGHGVLATGATTQGVIVQGATTGVGANADISNQSSAQAAVTALSSAVSRLGNAQAAVGKGQNNFNYAINLAQSQVTNLAAAESRIRDADLAMEAANLSKAQILVQAGTAALAQANSAPQAILSLLRG